MNVSYAWIRSLLPGLEASPQEIADTLAMQGAPVDEIVDIGGPLRDIRIARVLETQRHPNADRLNLCRVDPGNGDILQVVCGAPNVRAGGVYPFAPVGAQLPGDITIRKSKIRGEESQGMLCSARELGLGRDHDGLMDLAQDTPIGGALIDALMLDDARIVVDVTPNRPDLLSHVGVAREVGAAYGIAGALNTPPGITDITAPHYATADARSEADGVRVAIDATDLCARYLGLTIRGVNVAPSPAWLAGRLRAIGLRPISNVVDVTNYVLHELGQPLHAFDLAKIDGGITVRRARKDEKIVTLDGVERALHPDMLLIADDARALAVAGVMGGADSEVGADTTDILLECALFDPASVRKTRTALGLSTDASYRFERGVDPDTMELALQRAAAMIVSIAGGSVATAAADARGTGRDTVAQISLRLKRITQVLGIPFEAEQVRTLLSPLGYNVEIANADVLAVTVPGHRRYDVTREEDLIEDIARRHGYDRFPDELRPFRPSAVPDDPTALIEDRLRAQLTGAGLMESRTLAFVPERDGDVALMLPLSSAEGFLRRALVPSLLRRVEHNFSRGQRHVRLFEIGTAFLATKDAQVPEERRTLGIVLSGGRMPPHWSGDAPAFDLWDVRGILHTLVRGAAITPASDAPLPAWADANEAWVARSGDRVTAVAARVRPDAVDAPAWADSVYAVELDITALVDGAANGITAATTSPGTPFFKPIPTQPAVERDMALLVPQATPAAAVMEAITQSAGPLLEAVFPFDVYRGKGIDEGSRSIGIRMRFRAPDRTLTDEEVERALGRVLKSLKEDHGIDRRV